MADQDARALLLTIQANTELLRSNLSAAERAVEDFTNQTQKHLADSDARFEVFGKSIEKLEGPLERLKLIGEGAFAFLVGESLIEKGKQALEFAGNIQFMATQVGVSTDFLQKFRFAASQSGASIEVTDTSLIKFSRSVGEAANGNAGLVKRFNELGVGVLDAKGKVRSVEAVFNDTADAISKIDNPAQKTAATLSLFGRGAAALIPVLSGGGAGFAALGAAAERLGIVLGPELIEHAEDVNHKMAALKLILDAQMASAVAQNAGAIAQVAESLVKAAGGVAQFLAGHPERALAILGGLAGARVGGPYGAAVGAAAGYLYGEHLKTEQDDESTDLGVRRSRLSEAREAYHAARTYRPTETFMRDGVGSPTPSVNLEPARAELQKQLSLMSHAIAVAGKPKAKGGRGSKRAGVSNPDTTKPKKGKSQDQLDREAEAARQKALREDSAYTAELARTHNDYEKAEAALLDTARSQLNAELEALQISADAKDKEIDNQVAEGKITKAKGDHLKNLIDLTEADQEELARRKYQARLIDEAAAREALQVQGAVALLQLDDRLTTTRQQRVAIELRLLAYQEQQAIAEQQRIIDDNKSTPNSEAATNAQTTIGQIKAQSGRNQDIVRQQNQSPLDSYRQQLVSAVGSTDALNDSLQSVQVDGLKGLQDGFVGVVEGTKTLTSAFHDMAASIIGDLLKIGAEKVILSVLGFADGGSVPNVLHLAGGGNVFGAGGPRDDKVPAMLSAGEYVINAAAASRHRHLVEAINSDSLPHFADGGLVPNIRMPSMGSFARASAAPQVIYVQVDKSELFDTHVTRLAAPLAQAAMVGGAAQAQQDLADRQMAAIP
ncbi:hypothetical protein [Sphingomonas bacterium]|uniref:hypothetical protein n=1 Tax=Sphingomonas bacterium TaxID=1895847 RepID=UPI0015775388|nr:hypothetical protein [Sphingomonas bacterium]